MLMKEAAYSKGKFPMNQVVCCMSDIRVNITFNVKQNVTLSFRKGKYAIYDKNSIDSGKATQLRTFCHKINLL